MYLHNSILNEIMINGNLIRFNYNDDQRTLYWLGKAFMSKILSETRKVILFKLEYTVLVYKYLFNKTTSRF